ncbi:MAG: trypsin-like peptidase domain-containing protein [Planctomycetes bacterium]|nr:trypsin-like peptidase domain-containing protein [Planctomycetota bacterium]
MIRKLLIIVLFLAGSVCLFAQEAEEMAEESEEVMEETEEISPPEEEPTTEPEIEPPAVEEQPPAPNAEDTLIKKIDPGVVEIKHEQAIGSGFIISADGYILTNGHVVASVLYDREEDDPKATAKKITVTLFDNTRYQAKVIGHSLDPDVALIKIDPREPLTPVKIGNSDNVKSGQKVYAYGSPGGMKRTLTAGIVSNTERTDLPTFTKVLQTDASINPGNSGGPLLTEDAEVIGINTYGGRGGQGFTIPINFVLVLKDHYLKYGYFKRADFPYFISSEIYDELAQIFGVSDGILIDYVIPDSPAAKAGLMNGDILVELNGNAVSAKDKAQMRDFTWKLSTMEIGSTVKLKVLRGKKGSYGEHLITGKLLEDEPAVEYAYQFGELKELRYDDIGLGVKRMTLATSLIYRIPTVKGVRVVRVDGIAQKAGLAEGDIITHIDEQPVNGLDDFRSELEKRLAKTQKYILITLQRGNDTVKTALKPNYELSEKKIVVISPDGKSEYAELVNRFLITNGCFLINITPGDKKLDKLEFDAVLLANGEGVESLWSDKNILEILKQAVDQKKVIGAIGGASIAALYADTSLADKKITTDETFSKQIMEKTKKYTGKPVEQDGLLVTTTAFEKKIVKYFLGEFRNAIKGNE